MTAISRDMYNRIVELLIPFFENRRMRETLIHQALYGSSILNNFNWDGDANTFAYSLVSTLIQYGEEGEALRSILEELRNQVGTSKQEEIDDVLRELKKLSEIQDVPIEDSSAPSFHFFKLSFSIMIAVLLGALALSTIWFFSERSIEPFLAILAIIFSFIGVFQIRDV